MPFALRDSSWQQYNGVRSWKWRPRIFGVKEVGVDRIGQADAVRAKVGGDSRIGNRRNTRRARNPFTGVRKREACVVEMIDKQERHAGPRGFHRQTSRFITQPVQRE